MTTDLYFLSNRKKLLLLCLSITVSNIFWELQPWMIWSSSCCAIVEQSLVFLPNEFTLQISICCCVLLCLIISLKLSCYVYVFLITGIAQQNRMANILIFQFHVLTRSLGMTRPGSNYSFRIFSVTYLVFVQLNFYIWRQPRNEH